LGSLPGERSLSCQQYYAHPYNQFWRLLGALIGLDLSELSYDQKLRSLRNHQIALWDVVATAVRSGSLDTALRQVVGNDLTGLIAKLPQLRVIAFNGATAARVGRQAGIPPGIKLLDLPSSSPAYTMKFADKLLRWHCLKDYLRALEPSPDNSVIS
jgi:double-stranded uracil-DNA glycosylase